MFYFTFVFRLNNIKGNEKGTLFMQSCSSKNKQKLTYSILLLSSHIWYSHPEIGTEIKKGMWIEGCIYGKKKKFQKRASNITLTGWPLGLGNELRQSSSCIRVGKLGVKGWRKLEVNEEPACGVDSNSLWRSPILCRSSFKYSTASPSIEALSILVLNQTCQIIQQIHTYENHDIYTYMLISYHNQFLCVDLSVNIMSHVQHIPWFGNPSSQLKKKVTIKWWLFIPSWYKTHIFFFLFSVCFELVVYCNI